MDRREFLITSGAATAATATGSALASAEVAHAAPAIGTGRTELRFAVEFANPVAGPGDQATRLARRIELATDGRIRLVPAFGIQSGFAALTSAEADVAFSSTHDQLEAHPAFAYFAGLPGTTGLDANDLEAWMLVGGGQVLWDDLAGGFGVKTLLAGHAGSDPLLWSMQPITTPADLTDRSVVVARLGQRVVRALGAVPALQASGDIKRGFESGSLFAAECGGAITSLSLGVPSVARYALSSGIHRFGSALSVAMRRAAWDRLTATEQSVFATAAAAEYRLALAEERAHGAMIRAMWSAQRGLHIGPASAATAAAIETVARAVVADVASLDRMAARIDASYMAFKRAVAPDQGTADPAV